MSDEINLNDPNLCTTEEAFEQFQTVSTCEEDDFITLSDILPPPSPEHNPVSELDDVPYDNEVELPAFLEQQEVSTVSAPFMQYDTVANTTTISESDVSVSTEQSAVTDDQHALPIVNDKPKRGRRKRASTLAPTPQICDDSNVAVDSTSQQNENFETTPAAVRTRRGRQKKSLDVSLNSTNNANTPQNQKRRGRPKRQLTEGECVGNESGNGQYAETSTDYPEVSDTSANVEKRTPRRRARAKNNSLNTLDATEDILKNNLDGNYLETTDLKPAVKVPKRTRKKKVNKKESDDDDDDLSLSQIKKDGTKLNGAENLALEEDPIAKVIPQELGVESQLIPDPNEQNGNISEMLVNNENMMDADQMLVDNVDNEVVVRNDDMEIDIVGTEETKFYPITPQANPPENSDFISNTGQESIRDNADIKKENESVDNLLVEDPTKRPVRRKARKTLHYDEGSDEDPFANVELSDDEPKTRKKGKRYNSDDEYVPGKKQSSSEISDSDVEEHFGVTKPKRKRGRSGMSQNRSPRKKNQSYDQSYDQSFDQSIVEEKKPPDVSTITPHTIDQEDDIEECLQTSVIKAPDEFNQFKAKNGKMSDHSSEFENFLAQKIHGTDLQIKKVSSSEPLQTTPLAIPVLDPKELIKTVENCTQTTSAKMQAIGTQTSTQHDVPMKKNIGLSAQQSEKACEFLKSVVKTTAELGQLMTQKSEDFIAKKINTDNVTDTLKMDYCVKKSFLLFKLAKHNLVQMEEDLSKQYEEFLKENKLDSCREKPVEVVPKSKAPDSDSDCEFVEETKPSTSKQKSKFNPKTVFLNKELSIKIAKKPDPVNKPNKKNLNIKGKHSVWISDSVMVKKVAPTQSFLEQDSRNKKPPDTYVTEKMVSDFFEEYTRRQIKGICAPFTSTEWLTPIRTNVCSYYFVKTDSLAETAECFTENDDLSITPGQDCSTSEAGKSLNSITAIAADKQHSSPESLSTLCTRTVRKYLQSPSINGLMPPIENGHRIDLNVPIVEKMEEPKSLFQLCLNSLMRGVNSHTINHSPSLSNGYNFPASPNVLYNALPLKKICSSKIIAMCSSISPEQKLTDISPTYSEYEDSLIDSSSISPEHKMTDISPTYSAYEDSILSGNISDDEDFTEETNEVKSLFSLCVDWIRNNQHPNKIMHQFTEDKMEQHVLACFEPDCLKRIAFETVKFLMYKNCTFDIDDELTWNGTENNNITMKYKVKRLTDICFDIVTKSTCDGTEEQSNSSAKLTINSVNTLSEEAFHNIDQSCQNTADNSQFLDEDDEPNYYDDDSYDASTTNNYEEDSQTEESNWVSKLQMKELMSCLAIDKNTNENQISAQGESPTNSEEQPVIARIKMEPAEEVTESIVDPAIVKVEPLHNLDEMTVIPDGVFTKQEHDDTSPLDPIEQSQQSLRRGSFDMSTFENFVRSNKMMHAEGEEYSNPGDEIFSQSGLRVRRQYEPDSDNENIENDPKDLLVAQTFEPLTIETAKDHLMESSSDEGSSSKKATDKKKQDKKGRGRPRKQEKQQASKEKVVAPPVPTNEVARLTKRMRERIRQEEKKVESSDSDTETLPLSKKKDKTKPDSRNVDDEIQCNNVDSTEQLEKVSPGNDDFQGFSAVDQNEITSYQKYVKYVYDKIMPQEDDSAKGSDNINLAVSTSVDDATPLINPDEPVEMLECEPTMPIFDEETSDTNQKKTRRSANKQKTKEKIVPEEKVKQVAEKKIKQVAEEKTKQDAKEKTEVSPPLYTERDGWKLYSIANNETKLYENCGIILEKLPESFVETYFRYQNITVTRKEDEEVNRLINLNTLNRSGNLRDGKKHKSKGKEPGTQAEENASDGSRAASPANSDRYDELTPSEDEANVDDEVPPPAPRQGVENNLAKNLLMGDSDSDGEKRIKTELNDDSETTDKSKKKKSSPKTKAVEKTTESPENLMLTADKMMNKELNLLHAPVVLDDNDAAETSTPKGPITRHKRRGGSSKHSRHMEKNEDDSSSEEEKQWVSTKEKLLKRMGKKDTAIEDDAKRAKLEKEFIERRGEDAQTRRRGRGRPRKLSHRALLEREKQLRVLSSEMMSEGDPRLHVAKQSASYFKGRRNIRKVIDKKSLQRSTVIANMEEFERKCRLNQRQARLREILGCEEGVNVVVMNDELCLEYDFEEQQAAVSVHPFFTKVMKAHQYEGVKFMWDACFESLEKVESGHQGGGCILAHCMGLGKTLQVLALLHTVESGHQGGGCILAHCMGLGKTLQVLALLHTVLTHPRVGIQRVLVCCPLSTVLNWVDEIHKWIGPVTDQIKVFELSKLKKTYERAYQLEDWYNGGGIFIIGYELFRSLSLLDPVLDDVRPTIVNKIRMALLDPGPDIVICDEGHLLKNDCSVLAVAMSRVQTRRRIVLTGTPMQNNLREYYCMVNFVKPNLLGTYSEYSNRFENPIMNGQHRDSLKDDIKLMKQRTHILHKVLEGCLQRQEASVLYPYLPKKHEYTVFISLTECQWDLYKHYMNNYARQSKQNVLKDFHILQKIWSHPQVLHNFLMRWRENKAKEAEEKIKPEKVEDDLAQEDLASLATSAVELKPAEAETWWLPYLDGGRMLDTLASSNKFVAVFRILDECIELGDKVLIFSTSLITMDTLEFFLKKINKWSLGQEYYRLDGCVPAEVRQKWCREFNAENNHKTKLFLISTRAGCLGLNMVAANRVIILDTSWNPAHDIQSIFRVYRFGQKKDCYIYRLVALGTMEQKIYERSVTKQAVACRVVDEQQIDRHYNMAELTELYKYDEHGVLVAGGVAVGVEDVALLRVARDAALHAVHEHDSLLRGSSETALPEHERNAAWMQFQQEQAHKQIQNQLTPMPTVKRTYGPKKNQQDISPLLQPPEIKTEDQATPAPYQVPVSFEPPPETKGKKGRPRKIVQEQQALAIDDNIVQKIMNILIKHNYQQRQGPKEISELVASVRKIVAFGKVPPKLGLDQELTQSIANVLLGRDSPPPLTDVKPQIEIRQKGTVEPEEILPSTSSEPMDGRSRRRAALAARMQIDSLGSDAVIDLDDDDWQGGSDTDDAPEADTQKPPEKPKPMSKKSKQIVQTEKQLNSEINSILLSDDEDVSSKSKDKTADSGELVPLHPSLLSNKNFIKIVAHTYLEGNPMLDEDAATLAAQYSTLKALKEYESTGRKIESGPIYDIAVKVLGKDILKKLNKSNPAIPKPSAPAAPAAATQPPEVKQEPQDLDPKSTGRVKPKGISELIAPAAPVEPRKRGRPRKELVPSEQIDAAATSPAGLDPYGALVEPRKRGRPSKASILAEQAAAAGASPDVVPVGLIKMTDPQQSPAPMAPIPAPQPQPQPFADGEESILPDDDVTISQPPIKTEPRKNSKPLILNTVLSQSKKQTPVVVRRNIAPKIQISSGSIVMSHSAPLTTTAPMIPAQTSQDTICLDSDEEESITPNLPTKRVALKSTASRPVNVNTFMTEPQQPPQSQTNNIPPNCIVIPAAEFERLRKIPMGLVPHKQIMQQQSMMQQQNIMQQQNMMQQHTMMQQGYMQQNMNLGTSVPQSMTMMGTHQNLNFANPQMLNYTQVPAQSAPLMTALPQMSAPSQPMLVPAAQQPSPQSILPTPDPPSSKKTKLNKTVCKPGDILRITPSGQVEILKRDDEPAQQAPPPARAQGIAKKSTTKPPMATRSSNNGSSNNVVSLADEKTPETKQKSRVRKLSSSSSSSSASSRHSSPDRDDPLSILKDVVHIRAADDDAPKKQSKTKQQPIPIRRMEEKQSRTTAKPATSQPQSQIGNISITKTYPQKGKTAPPAKNSTSITPTKDKVMSLINQTDSMLKQLNSVLTADKRTSKTKVDAKSQKVVESVDLTDLDAPSTSSNKWGKSENVNKYSGKAPLKGSPQQSLLKKTVSSPASGSPSGTKVVGTSSSIILKSSGGKKQVMVMKEQRAAAPAPAAKRAAPAPPPAQPKKKKNEPMTLKDFDIDDIDDIIELD